MAGCVSGVMNWDSIVSSENFKRELTMTLWLHKDSCEALVFFNTLKFSFVETKISNSIGKSNRHMKSMPVLKVPIGGKIWRPFSWSFFLLKSMFFVSHSKCAKMYVFGFPCKQHSDCVNMGGNFSHLGRGQTAAEIVRRDHNHNYSKFLNSDPPTLSA